MRTDRELMDRISAANPVGEADLDALEAASRDRQVPVTPGDHDTTLLPPRPRVSRRKVLVALSAAAVALIALAVGLRLALGTGDPTDDRRTTAQTTTLPPITTPPATAPPAATAPPTTTPPPPDVGSFTVTLSTLVAAPGAPIEMSGTGCSTRHGATAVASTFSPHAIEPPPVPSTTEPPDNGSPAPNLAPSVPTPVPHALADIAATVDGSWATSFVVPIMEEGEWHLTVECRQEDGVALTAETLVFTVGS